MIIFSIVTSEDFNYFSKLVLNLIKEGYE